MRVAQSDKFGLIRLMAIRFEDYAGVAALITVTSAMNGFERLITKQHFGLYSTSCYHNTQWALYPNKIVLHKCY